MGSGRLGHDWVNKLNWTDCLIIAHMCKSYPLHFSLRSPQYPFPTPWPPTPTSTRTLLTLHWFKAFHYLCRFPDGHGSHTTTSQHFSGIIHPCSPSICSYSTALAAPSTNPQDSLLLPHVLRCWSSPRLPVLSNPSYPEACVSEEPVCPPCLSLQCHGLWLWTLLLECPQRTGAHLKQCAQGWALGSGTQTVLQIEEGRTWGLICTVLVL